jgi:hypothetical protein
MATYHTILARVVASLYNTELTVQNIEADAEDKQEQRVQASLVRIRQLSDRRSQADTWLQQAAEVRATHGLTPTLTNDPAGVAVGHGLSLDDALASVRQSRYELDVAQAEYQAWRRQGSRTSKALMLALTGIMGVVAAIVLVKQAGAPLWSSATLALLAAGTIAVVTCGAAIAAIRQVPEISAPETTTITRAAALARFSARLAVPTVLGLLAVRVVAQVMT